MQETVHKHVSGSCTDACIVELERVVADTGSGGMSRAFQVQGTSPVSVLCFEGVVCSVQKLKTLVPFETKPTCSRVPVLQLHWCSIT